MKKLFTLIVLLMLGACQSMTGIQHDYPANWPTRIVENKCPDLSGTFINHGMGKYGSAFYQHHLSFHLFQRRVTKDNKPTSSAGFDENDKAEYITITQQMNSGLLVQISDNTKIIESRALSKDRKNFICREGVLWIDSGIESQSEGVGYARSHYKLGLQRTEDGSLVGQLHNANVALAIWVIPVGGKQVHWFKWPKVVN